MKYTLHITLVSSLLLWTACGNSGAPPAASTPDQAIRNVANSMQNDDPTGVWHMLPGSYQQDLTEVVRAYAGAMDADLWKAGATTLGKAEEVLRTKKELLLTSNFANMAGGRAQIETAYDHAARLIGILKSSDVMDLQRLQNVDLQKLISTTGRELMQELAKIDTSSLPVPGMNDSLNFRDTLAGLQAQTLSQDGDSAVVQITYPGESPEETAFTRVEGKWIPEEMVSEWQTMITGMREGVSQIAAIAPNEKAQALGMMTMANGVLDQMLAAKTKEDMETVLSGLMGMLMMGGGF